IGIVLAMGLESACIPLPSEIVMPLAGYMAFKHPAQFSLVGVGLAGAIGCVVGSAVAYAIGSAGGRPLLLKYGKYVLISKADSDRADYWFEHYGAPVTFFSRLLPVVRTYISLPAGISKMPFGQFILFTLLGSLPWTFALAYVGYAFGDAFQQKLAQLSSIFRGLDIVILVLLAIAIALYIYRHVKHNARASDPSSTWERPQQPVRRP
ncbi:MAG: DedA family protein, partial [Ktedonobacterales bacterium]|nr:DedA family protein [Ktedonobacterales bacterium]